MALYINGQKVSGGGGASSLEELTDVTIDPETLAGGQTIVYDDTNDEWVNGEGGGKHWEGTYSEYLSLETKDPDTVYFITDISDSNDRFQPVIYSEDEREIGVFTDGKPLYQKTFYATFYNISQSNPQTIADISSIGIDTVVKVDGSCLYSAQDNPSLYEALGGHFFCYTYPMGNLTFSQTMTATTTGRQYDVEATVYYTKTTDIAGSGTWTPQGISAHHYSTSEHVVGTWIDGSTIFEKTMNPTCSVGDNTLNHNISNFGRLVSIEGVCKYNNGSEYLYLPYTSTSPLSYTIYISNVTNTTYKVGVGSGFSSIQDCYVTIRYTKSSS